jgi:tetratricopeptide (TPR) repeat protein
MLYNEAPNDCGVATLLAAFEAMLEGEKEVFLSRKDYEQLITYFDQAELSERALELADAGLEQFPDAEELMLYKTHLLLARQEGVKALEILDRMNQLCPVNPDLLLLRAEALTYSGAHATALELLESMAKDSDNAKYQAKIHYVKSIVFEQRRDYRPMLESLKDSLYCNWQNEAAIHRLGIAAWLTRSYGETIEICKYLLDNDPYSHLAWYNLGQAYEFQGLYEEALQAYEYAFLANPVFEAAYREYIELCLALKAYEKGLSAIEEAMAYLEEDAELWLSKGKCHFYQKEFALARKSLLRALALDTMCDEAFYFVGKCYAKEDAWSWAAYYFQKALAIDGEMEDYLAALGEAYFKMGMYNRGSNYWRHAIRMVPEEALYWSRYATLLLNAGRPADALAILEEAEEWASGYPLDLALCACLYALGRKQEALEVLSQTLPDHSNVPAALSEFLPELESDPEIRAMLAYYGAIVK